MSGSYCQKQQADGTSAFLGFAVTKLYSSVRCQDAALPFHPGYQLWDSIQGLSSYVRGMLSSQAMLAGVGVGSAAATPLGAVFQVGWVGAPCCRAGFEELR